MTATVELARLVAAVQSVTQQLSDLYTAQPSETEPFDPEWEELAGDLHRQERRVRDFLAAYLINTFKSSPLAIVMPDGCIVAYTDVGDGLAVVPAESVIKLQEPQIVTCPLPVPRLRRDHRG
jgi:hypothetical protein